MTGSFSESKLAKSFVLVALLYVFLVSIALMSSAFKLLGKDFAETLMTTTSSPVVGLMVGLLATALIQSSSTTTSLIVGMVSANAISVQGAVPMIMGANMGTTVTNTIVAMGSMSRREEFKRAFAGATVHDFFNVLAVLILFPLEMTTHVLQRTANRFADLLVGTEAVEFTSPVKTVTKPAAKAIVHQLETLGLSDAVTGALVLTLAIGGIFFALFWLPRLMKQLFLARAEGAFFRLLSGGGLAGILVGVFITVLVQSSSITTSLLIPMIGAGVLSLEGAFAVTLGANIGTTVTALLASAAGTHDAVVVALVHLLFNLAGILIIYPVPALRRIPIWLATRVGELSLRHRWVAAVYLLFLFFLLPGLIILGQRFFSGT